MSALVFLASPYSHTDPWIRYKRYRAAATFVVKNLTKDVGIFSPIVYSHTIAVQHNLPIGFEFWEILNGIILRKCNALWVLTLDGWKVSRGVQWELSMAKEHSIPIALKSPEKDVPISSNPQ
jgi:hypothetical protein